MKSNFQIISLALLLTLASLTARGAAQYSVIDIGTLGSPQSVAFDLNAAARVVGYSPVPTADIHTFLWQGGIADLSAVSGSTQTIAFSINAGNTIAGIAYNYTDLDSRAVKWTGGVPTVLGNFNARGMNANGDIAGYRRFLDTDLFAYDHAVAYKLGALSDLPSLGGSNNYALDIDSSGREVGYSQLSDGTTVHACLWRPTGVVDLGTLGGSNSEAYAINDVNTVVGNSETAAGVPHATLFSVDSAGNLVSRTDLDTLNSTYSYAYGANNSNQVVGLAGGHAFIWQNGTMFDLNGLLIPGANWVLQTATAINDQGLIAGTGLNPFGFPHAYMLVPSALGMGPSKAMPDGTGVSTPQSIVTAAFNGYFYIEDPSRASGVRVVLANHGLTVGQQVTVSGVFQTNADGEHFIQATSATPTGTGNVNPVEMNTRNIGGRDFAYDPITHAGQKGVHNPYGLNNIGLLISTAGRVSSIGSGVFYIDDGSQLVDSSGLKGIRVIAPGMTLPGVGQEAFVTGISSCYAFGNELYKQILVRTQSDIR